MGERIVIIDGNSLINRAYYAMMRPMITKEGVYTQAIFGFLNMLYKIFDDYAPDRIAVAWDRKSPTFRHEEYKDYKAGRRKMPPELAMEIPLMKDILAAMNIQCLEIDGFEADDIIGTLAKASEEQGLSPLIITGDRDALQLASDTTEVLITRKGISEFDLYDREKMIERYELTPEQFIDLKGLMGDQSDNIPGIPGVGEKTGIKLLKQFGSVAELLARTDEIENAKLRQKVEDNAQLAAMSRHLAEIITNVPIDFDLDAMKVREPDRDKLIDLFVKLEFNTFLKRLHFTEKEAPAAAAETAEIKEEILIRGEEDLAALEKIEEGAEVVFHLFSDHSHVGLPTIQGIALLSGGTYYHVNGDDALTEKAASILNDKKLRLCGHDLIRALYVLRRHGLYGFETGYDTAVAQYVLEPARSTYDLKVLSMELFHREIQSEAEYAKANAQMDMLGDSAEKEREYGKTLCRTIADLKDLQAVRLKKAGADRVLEEAELPLIPVLASMEEVGFCADGEELDRFGQELKAEIADLTEKIYEAAGETFNINSTQQLGDILFVKLGLPSGKKTKKGYSTNAEILEKIRDKHPLVDLVLRYRALTKLNSTYVEGLKPLIGEDGRIRAHFQQTVTATGRISCTEPNLQNIPIRSEYGRLLRKAFRPSPGNILIGADYSQIELRVLAHLSGDESLIDAFNRGADIHRTTAARVFGLDYDEVTPLDRSRAKAVNFGVIYGMSGFGLSEELHISRKEAERYIEDYFDKHKAVKAYMDGQVAFCRENGYTETILGRRRYIPEIRSSNYMTRMLGERLAMNSPIQGSAADIIKLAMIAVYRELTEKGYKAKLILQVHDELIIDTPPEEQEAVSELLVRNMQNAMSLKVELLSDLNTGSTWYDLK